MTDTPTTDQVNLDRIIRSVTDGWDEPLDEVHDVPLIRNAILASDWMAAHDAEVRAAQRERDAAIVEEEINNGRHSYVFGRSEEAARYIAKAIREQEKN